MMLIREFMPMPLINANIFKIYLHQLAILAFIRGIRIRIYFILSSEK